MKINLPKTGEKVQADYALGFEAGYEQGKSDAIAELEASQPKIHLDDLYSVRTTNTNVSFDDVRYTLDERIDLLEESWRIRQAPDFPELSQDALDAIHYFTVDKNILRFDAEPDIGYLNVTQPDNPTKVQFVTYDAFERMIFHRHMNQVGEELVANFSKSTEELLHPSS